MGTERKKPRRQWAHPLSGANLGTLLAVLRRNGLRGVDPARLGVVAGAVLGRAPFTVAERAWVRHRLRRVPARAGPMPPPIFIVGHWRSGTTHLYNTLCQSGRFGYVPPVSTGLPWDMLLLARLMRPVLERMLPSERFIDRIPVTPTSPQEDEAAMANMQAVSFYHALYFPRRLREEFNRGVFFDGCSQREVDAWARRFDYFLRKLWLQQPGKPLLIKNPVYTARVGMLRAMYPEAKFIHIRRNPYVVFQSMRNFYTKLIDAYALQQPAEADVDELILEAYPRMMRELAAATTDLPPERFIEISYEELDDEPMPVLERLYGQLGLDGFDEARPAFEAYLASIAGYRKNRYAMSPDAADRVSDRWAAFVEQWGYSVPAGA